MHLVSKLFSLNDLGTYEKVLLGSLIFAVVALIIRYINSIPYPANIPRVREKNGATRFSLKTRLAYYTDCEGLFRDAYENVKFLAEFLSKDTN
jgi:hypothetical protein